MFDGEYSIGFRGIGCRYDFDRGDRFFWGWRSRSSVGIITAAVIRCWVTEVKSVLDRW